MSLHEDKPEDELSGEPQESAALPPRRCWLQLDLVTSKRVSMSCEPPGLAFEDSTNRNRIQGKVQGKMKILQLSNS